MKKTTLTLALIAALALAGCGTLDGKIDNRVACTAGKDKGYVVSEWGPLGITGKLAANHRRRRRSITSWTSPGRSSNEWPHA